MTASIYVASLTDYNAGRLHGEWFDVLEYSDGEDLLAAVDRMLRKSPTARFEGIVAEEWAIHDYEGFEGFKLSEWARFDEVFDLAKTLNELERHGEAEAFTVYMQDVVSWDSLGDLTDAVSDFRDAYIGEISPTDYAYDAVEDMLHGLPETVRMYFDYEAYGRDLITGGDMTYTQGHLFWNH
ncbi:antirestriction protein ArdA [Nocardia sp. IFM 10818]